MTDYDTGPLYKMVDGRYEFSVEQYAWVTEILDKTAADGHGAGAEEQMIQKSEALILINHAKRTRQINIQYTYT